MRTENDSFQILRALRDNRQKRAKRGEIFVEGVAAINALANSGRGARAVAYAADARLSGWAKDTIRRLSPDVGFELDPRLQADLSERGKPSELIVIAERPSNTMEVFPPLTDRSGPILLVDRPSNLGNLGSILRSAEAFGATGVVTTGHGVDPYDPQVIRASLGACFYQTLVHEPSTKRVIRWLEDCRNSGARIVATDSNGTATLDRLRPDPPLIVIFGNEATGVSASLREAADEIVAISIGGRVDSLNLACAASIVLYALATTQPSS